MKKIIILTGILAIALLSSCNKYLDIVPDNIATIDNAFTMRSSAEKFLHTCYSYLPTFSGSMSDPGRLGSGELTCLEANASRFGASAWYVARGYQNASEPWCNFWNGEHGGNDLYEGIRNCNIFIEKIATVPDMDRAEILRMTDEAKFLKAYYHFFLTRMYGPIPIMDKNLEIDSSIDEVHVYRNTIDECFEYIVGLLDEILAEKGLPDMIEAEASELGRISKGVVLAFKAQVLVYAASPLFNGNTDYKGYTDNRGVEIFCPDKTDAERLQRWQTAAEACKTAIDFWESQGYTLFNYTSEEYNISEPTRYMMTRRGSFTEQDNKENIWYYTNAVVNQYSYFPFRFNGTNTAGSGGSDYAAGIMSAPVETAELYYTKHGLPIDQDITWSYSSRFELRHATEEDRIFLRPDYNMVSLVFDRENRFYSDLGFDGSSWFGNNVTVEGNIYLQCRSNQINGVLYSSVANCTGYYPRKYVHHKSIMSSTGKWTAVNYQYPIQSMRDLYLLYAEALNEAGADYSEVLPYLNKIRARSGVPTVEDSWDNYSASPGKYKEKTGLREIIHRERTIELMFEGHRIWDVRRWKEGLSAFNGYYTGWNYSAYKDEEYYSQKMLFKQSFEVKDYFWPIKKMEIYCNPNLVQNPGW